MNIKVCLLTGVKCEFLDMLIDWSQMWILRYVYRLESDVNFEICLLTGVKCEYLDITLIDWGKMWILGYAYWQEWNVNVGMKYLLTGVKCEYWDVLIDCFDLIVFPVDCVQNCELEFYLRLLTCLELMQKKFEYIFSWRDCAVDGR